MADSIEDMLETLGAGGYSLPPRDLDAGDG